MAKSAEARKRNNQRKRMFYHRNKLQERAKLQSGVALKETQKEIKKIERAIKSSYFDRDKGKYTEGYNKLELKLQHTKEYQQTISARIKPNKQQDNERITNMQKNYFRSAARTEAQKQAGESLTQQQRLSRAEQSFFMAATRVLWQGGSPNMRYENIVAGLNSYGARLSSGRIVENLQDAVQFIKETYGDAYPTMDKVKEGYFDYDESEPIAKSSRPLSAKRLRGLSK